MPTLLRARRLALLGCGLLSLGGLLLGYQALAAPARPFIRLSWSTASELEHAGFNVYRSEQPDGPFTRVNGELIPATGDPLAGAVYVFTDTQVLAGHTYFYQLESIARDGSAVVEATSSATPQQDRAGTLVPSLLLLGLGLAGLLALGRGHKLAGA